MQPARAMGGGGMIRVRVLESLGKAGEPPWVSPGKPLLCEGSFALGVSGVGQSRADLFTHPRQEAEHAGNKRPDGCAHVISVSESIVIYSFLSQNT